MTRAKRLTSLLILFCFFAQIILGQEKVFFGNLHSEALGSDHIGIATNNALYKGADANSLISTARSFTVNDQFIALYGQEFSTISSGNHSNVFDIGEVIDVPKGRFDLLDAFLQTRTRLGKTLF